VSSVKSSGTTKTTTALHHALFERCGPNGKRPKDGRFSTVGLFVGMQDIFCEKVGWVVVYGRPSPFRKPTYARASFPATTSTSRIL